MTETPEAPALTYEITLRWESAAALADLDFDGILEELSEKLGDPDSLDDIEWYDDSCDFWINTADPDGVIAVARPVFSRHGLTGSWTAAPVDDE
ncbi:MAG: hypothetical protein V9F00_10355 [Nocardioides sp.]|jgi:hypothetical protein